MNWISIIIISLTMVTSCVPVEQRKKEARERFEKKLLDAANEQAKIDSINFYKNL